LGRLDASRGALAEHVGEVRRLLLLGELAAQREQRAVAAVVLERGGGLRQAFGDSTQAVRRDGGCQRPVGGAGGPIGPLPAEAENRLPVVARTCAQQRREEPDGVVGI